MVFRWNYLVCYRADHQIGAGLAQALRDLGELGTLANTYVRATLDMTPHALDGPQIEFFWPHQRSRPTDLLAHNLGPIRVLWVLPPKYWAQAGSKQPEMLPRWSNDWHMSDGKGRPANRRHVRLANMQLCEAQWLQMHRRPKTDLPLGASVFQAGIVRGEG